MARKSSGKSQSSHHGKDNEKLRGPNSDSLALKTRSMDEVLGIEAIDFGLGIKDVMTPKLSIQQLQQYNELTHTFNEWLQSLHKEPRGITQMSMEVSTELLFYNNWRMLHWLMRMMLKLNKMQLLGSIM